VKILEKRKIGKKKKNRTRGGGRGRGWAEAGGTCSIRGVPGKDTTTSSLTVKVLIYI